jgi:DNA-binding NtrC family response regulator
VKIEGKLAVEYGLALNLVNNNSNKHILVVDDESDIVDVIRFCLQMYDYKACTFIDPLAALEHFKSNLKSHHMIISYY